MKKFLTHELTPATMPMSETEKLWLYNGLDCCVTAEVLDVLHPQLDNLSASTYAFEMELQEPVLEMRLRGVRISFKTRDEALKKYEQEIEWMSEDLDDIIADGVGAASLNWRSPQQLNKLFYEVLRIPSSYSARKSYSR